MDLSFLPRTTLSPIAVAEIEADFILRSNVPLFGILDFQLDHEGAEPERGKDPFLAARNQAALHLLRATSAQLRESLRSDWNAFRARLEIEAKAIYERFQPSEEVWEQELTFSILSAREEAEHHGSKSWKRLRGGALLAAARQLPLLKESRLDECMEAPQMTQGLPPIVPKEIAEVCKASTTTALLTAIPKALPELRARKGGRPVFPINGEKLVEIRGDKSQTQFARDYKVSVDALQRAERDGRSSKKTIRKIVNKLRRDGRIDDAKELVKKHAAVTAET